jgi:hypothetical protein
MKLPGERPLDHVELWGKTCKLYVIILWYMEWIRTAYISEKFLYNDPLALKLNVQCDVQDTKF